MSIHTAPHEHGRLLRESAGRDSWPFMDGPTILLNDDSLPGSFAAVAVAAVADSRGHRLACSPQSASQHPQPLPCGLSSGDLADILLPKPSFGPSIDLSVGCVRFIGHLS